MCPIALSEPIRRALGAHMGGGVEWGGVGMFGVWRGEGETCHAIDKALGCTAPTICRSKSNHGEFNNTCMQVDAIAWCAAGVCGVDGVLRGEQSRGVSADRPTAMSRR